MREEEIKTAKFVEHMVEGWLNNLRHNLMEEHDYFLTPEIVQLALENVKQRYDAAVDISDDDIQAWLNGDEDE